MLDVHNIVLASEGVTNERIDSQVVADFLYAGHRLVVDQLHVLASVDLDAQGASIVCVFGDEVTVSDVAHFQVLFDGAQVADAADVGGKVSAYRRGFLEGKGRVWPHGFFVAASHAPVVVQHGDEHDDHED
jgi:hypothetical protein